MIPAEPEFPCNQIPGRPIVWGYVQPGRSRCLTRTRIRASKTRTRARSPASSRAVARSLDSNSKIRTVRARTPISRVSRGRADVSSDLNQLSESTESPAERRDFFLLEALEGQAGPAPSPIKGKKRFKFPPPILTSYLAPHPPPPLPDPAEPPGDT